MTYPKSSNTRGIILIDILLALSLAALFIAIITESSYGARDLFDRSRERMRLMDAFEAYMANGVGTSSVKIASVQRPYGNDRMETDFAISSNGTSSGAHSQSISFVAVHARNLIDTSGFIGTPLCTVDFSNKDVVGSYSFIRSMYEIDHDVNKALAPIITPIILPINPLLPLTDLEVRNGIAYVSDDSTTASDPDIFVIDFKDRKNSTVRSSLNTGPGIASIALAGQRIFTAAASTAAQLHTIRLNSLDNMSLENKYQLPPPYATATQPVASSIFYHLNKAYLGTEKWDGDELSVIDVSNPAHPTKVGGLETGSKINDIFVRDGTAYTADSDERQLRVLDVRDPNNPILTSSFNPSGWERQEGSAVSFFEDRLNLGRTSGGFNIAKDHEAFAWATTSSTTLASYISTDTPGGVYGVVADRSHLYLATRQTNKELQIFDTKLSTTTSASFSLPVAPQTLTCDGNRLYILAATAPVIYEISFN